MAEDAVFVPSTEAAQEVQGTPGIGIGIEGSGSVKSILQHSGIAPFLFALALLIRLIWVFLAPRVDPYLQGDNLHGDAASYDRVIRSLMAGTGYGEYPHSPTAFWVPGYPSTMAIFYTIFGYNLTLGRVFQAILGALFVLIVYLTAKRYAKMGLVPPVVPLLVGLGATFYPHLIYFGAWLIADTLYFLLIALFLLVALKLQQATSYRAALFQALQLGLIFGLTIQTKSTFLMGFPFLVIWLLIYKGNPTLYLTVRRRFYLGVTLLIAFSLTMAPWTIRNYTVFGTVVLGSTNGGYTFYGANNVNAFGGHRENFPPRIDGLNEAQQQSYDYQQALNWIKSDPAGFARLEVQKFRRLSSPLSVNSIPEDYHIPAAWLVYLLYYLFLLLALYGLLCTRPHWRDFFLLYIPLSDLLISTALFYGDTRYALAVLPSLLIFASLGLAKIWTFGTARWGRAV